MLLTRSPLSHSRIATLLFPLDLHVLTTPPAFTLSQNQTLRIIFFFNPLYEEPTASHSLLFIKAHSIRWTSLSSINPQWLSNCQTQSSTSSGHLMHSNNHLAIRAVRTIVLSKFQRTGFCQSRTDPSYRRPYFKTERPPIKANPIFSVKIFFNFFLK
ncbi:MAG: hypothetical protein DBX55_07215 [Verrucomicrobia bacterium]|nr:MAG: hypothetical protein DBX55_07215 [Verrucomicrobiota bacterium]